MSYFTEYIEKSMMSSYYKSKDARTIFIQQLFSGEEVTSFDYKFKRTSETKYSAKVEGVLELNDIDLIEVMFLYEESVFGKNKKQIS